METIPVEMVEMIVRQLTPQDLARCSAVCREWRELFNQDWMWQPHCDPELEEPLRTIPCLATPAFVAPEVENSTLSPISHWKLAFMRENHLWKNWRSKEIMEYKKENVTDSENKNIVVLDPLAIDFLTDTLVVVWYSNFIQILDVSAMPAVLVAETDTSFEIYKWDECSVIGTTMLLVEKPCFIEVFSVDIMNKSIKSKHMTILDKAFSVLTDSRIAKEPFFLCMDLELMKLTILDLNTGKTLKEELCPVKVNQNESVKFSAVKISPTSDFIAISFEVAINDGGGDYCKYYIYSLRDLTFLPSPLADQPAPCDMSNVSLHGHWLAYIDCKTLTVYNIQTSEILLNQEVSCYDLRYEHIYECNGSFIFKVRDETKSWVKSYSPLDRSLATLCEIPNGKPFKIINNKCIALFENHSRFLEIVWKLSGQMFETRGISVSYNCKINSSFTKVLKNEYLTVVGNLTWYIDNLW